MKHCKIEKKGEKLARKVVANSSKYPKKAVKSAKKILKNKSRTMKTSETMYGIYENGLNGRLLFIVKGLMNAKSIRLDYIHDLISMGEFKYSDISMLRDTIEVIELPKIHKTPVFGYR